jgi:uncharacterized protein
MENTVMSTDVPPDVLAKEENLRHHLRQLARVTVAYSGGVDSSFLLWEAVDTLGAAQVLAVLGDSDTLTPAERDAAVQLARDWGATVQVIHTDEMDNPAFVRNAPDRCYHCKKELFAAVRDAADAHFGPDSAILDGTNADDLNDRRPGRRAAAEAGVLTPLLAAGLSKADIRTLSRRHRLPTAERPPSPCLASRLPFGTPVSAPVLRQVSEAEVVLRELGFGWVRVRHHGPLARIEVPASDLPRLVTVAGEVAARLKKLGYNYITADLEGYRTGSLNETLKTEE